TVSVALGEAVPVPCLSTWYFSPLAVVFQSPFDALAAGAGALGAAAGALGGGALVEVGWLGSPQPTRHRAAPKGIIIRFIIIIKVSANRRVGRAPRSSPLAPWVETSWQGRAESSLPENKRRWPTANGRNITASRAC